jgi:putative oxidoreductase
MAAAPLSSLARYKDLALLILRIGLGVMFLLHGWPKLTGGPDRWAALGRAMGHLGIHVWPAAWGLAAAVAEFVGGALLLLGLWTRPAALLLAVTMFVAAVNHLAEGDGWMGASHAIEDFFILVALVFLGPGRHSIDER